jgi:predicted transcriptional regulator
VVVSVRLDEDTRIALERLAEENDRTLSAEVRRAIRLYLEQQAVVA